VWGFNGGIGADRFISNHISAGLSLDYRLINERSQAIRSDIHVVSASVKIGFWPSVKHKVKEEIKPAAQEAAAPKQEEIKPEETQKPEAEPMAEVKLSEQPAQVEEMEQAAQESPAAEPCTQKTHFTAAHYAFNVSKLNAADKAAIREQARQIKADGYKKIIITGHTDNIGTYVANRHLSKARAQLVAAEFRKAGIKDIEVRWVDYSQPVASNSTKEGRAQNRRTEVDIEK
jgi:outer membrane protein OmpA-like peptidoglycan-associated protein